MTEATWDLSIFYHGFDDPAFGADIQRIHDLLAEGQTLLNSDPPPLSKLEGIICLLEEISNVLQKAFSFCQLTLATQAQHSIALKALDELSLLMVDVEVMQSDCIRYIGAMDDLEGLIAESPLLSRNAFALRDAQRRAAHMLPGSMEKWMLRMSLSGADAFSKLRDQLMGTHTVEMDGKQLPLPAVRGMAYDPSAEVRKKAYEAELASYAKVELPMAFCLAGIKGEALTLAEAKGYPSVLSQQLMENHMDGETLEAMLTAIREALPDFRRYLKAKARFLGHPGGLPFYDLFAPLSQAGSQYSAQEARGLLEEVFSQVHPPMGAFIRHAFENRWIDLYPKEGKESGAFCAGSHQLKCSRILTNFVGSFSDVSTLAHELGHAWHNRCLEGMPLLQSEPPMPLAETASIFNETLLNQTIRQTADPQTAFALLEGSLMEATQTVVDIYGRYLFETAVLEARKTYTPTAQELKDMMLAAQEEAYGDGLAAGVRHPYMWVCKPHYYSKDMHFYNFPYAFGLLFGLGVYAKYQAQGSGFMQRYDALLAACASGLVADVAATVGIDVHSAAYWRGALDVIRREIDEFVGLVEKR